MAVKTWDLAEYRAAATALSERLGETLGEGWDSAVALLALHILRRAIEARLKDSELPPEVQAELLAQVSGEQAEFDRFLAQAGEQRRAAGLQ